LSGTLAETLKAAVCFEFEFFGGEVSSLNFWRGSLEFELLAGKFGVCGGKRVLFLNDGKQTTYLDGDVQNNKYKCTLATIC